MPFTSPIDLWLPIDPGILHAPYRGFDAGPDLKISNNSQQLSTWYKYIYGQYFYSVFSINFILMQLKNFCTGWLTHVVFLKKVACCLTFGWPWVLEQQVVGWHHISSIKCNQYKLFYTKIEYDQSNNVCLVTILAKKGYVPSHSMAKLYMWPWWMVT